MQLWLCGGCGRGSSLGVLGTVDVLGIADFVNTAERWSGGYSRADVLDAADMVKGSLIVLWSHSIEEYQVCLTKIGAI